MVRQEKNTIEVFLNFRSSVSTITINTLKVTGSMATNLNRLHFLTDFTRLSSTRPRGVSIPKGLLSSVAQTRLASKKAEKKKSKHKAFRVHDKTKLVQYSLCDAIR